MLCISNKTVLLASGVLAMKICGCGCLTCKYVVWHGIYIASLESSGALAPINLAGNMTSRGCHRQCGTLFVSLDYLGS